jgi:ParB-like chromosome segregation protein Spo0J
MGLGFHQLDLRYDRLRIARPDHERRLLSSLAEVGQQVPIVVVKAGSDKHFVVIDGYKRVRSLRRLGRDTVGSLCWECSEAEALVVSRLWHTGESETALEQSWLLVELHERFELSQEELARRFTRLDDSMALTVLRPPKPRPKRGVLDASWTPVARRLQTN